MGFAPWKFNISANKIVIYVATISGWSAFRGYSGNLASKSAVNAASCSGENNVHLFCYTLIDKGRLSMERKDVMDRAIRESVELHCHSVYSAKERKNDEEEWRHLMKKNDDTLYVDFVRGLEYYILCILVCS